MSQDPNFELDLLSTSNLLALMATFHDQIDQALLDNLVTLVLEGRMPGRIEEADADKTTRLVTILRKDIERVDRRKMLSNLVTHIYQSCAKLKVEDS